MVIDDTIIWPCDESFGAVCLYKTEGEDVPDGRSNRARWADLDKL